MHQECNNKSSFCAIGLQNYVVLCQADDSMLNFIVFLCVWVFLPFFFLSFFFVKAHCFLRKHVSAKCPSEWQFLPFCQSLHFLEFPVLLVNPWVSIQEKRYHELLFLFLMFSQETGKGQFGSKMTDSKYFTTTKKGVNEHISFVF